MLTVVCQQLSPRSRDGRRERVPMNAPKHRPQPQCKVTFAGHLSVPTAGTGGPEVWARAPSHCCSVALIEKNWHEGTGGILKSAQQPPAHVDLHTSIGAPRGQGQWLKEYKLSRGAGKDNYLLGFPARCIRRPLR